MPENSSDRVLKPSGRFEWERFFRRVPVKPPSAKLIGFILSTFANYDTGARAHPGQAQLADMAGVSERQVRSGLKVLEELGLIQQVSRGSSRGRGAKGKGLASEYQLTIPSDLLQAVEALRINADEHHVAEISDGNNRRHTSGANEISTGGQSPEFLESTGNFGDKHRQFHAKGPAADFRPHVHETHPQKTHRTSHTSASPVKPVDNSWTDDENLSAEWAPIDAWASPFDETPPF